MKHFERLPSHNVYYSIGSMVFTVVFALTSFKNNPLNLTVGTFRRIWDERETMVN